MGPLSFGRHALRGFTRGWDADHFLYIVAWQGCRGLRCNAQVDVGARLNVQRDKNSILFSGTKVLQHTGDKGARVRTPDGGCLAVVLRTGFETSQGVFRVGWARMC